MNVLGLSLLFPVVLAVHNAEELFQYDEFVRVYHRGPEKRFLSKPTVRNATILLTLAGAVLGGYTFAYRTPALIDTSIVASMALMLNAVSHISTSVKERSLTPGTLSALLLVLPYSALLIRAAHLPWAKMLWLVLLGSITVPTTIVLFLFLGYSLHSLSRTWTASH